MTLRPRILPLLLATALLQLSCGALARTDCEFGDAPQRSAIEQLCPMKEGLARIQIQGRWGFVDPAGKVAIAPRFQDARDFSEGRAAARVDGLWGLIDKEGQWVAKPAFKELESFSHGLARAQVNGRNGYIDRSGNWVIAPQFLRAYAFTPSAAVVEYEDDSDALIDRTGKVIKHFAREVRVDNEVSRSGLFTASVEPADLLVNIDGRRLPFPALARDYQDGTFVAASRTGTGYDVVELFGVVDTGGKWIVPARFGQLERFHGKLAVAAPPVASAETAARFGLIDRKGNFVVKPDYKKIERTGTGIYLGQRTDREVSDLLDANGKAFASIGCHQLDLSKAFGSAALLSGCQSQWLVHLRDGLVKTFTGEWQSSLLDGHLLMTLQGGEDDDSGMQFEIFNDQGKRVAGTDPAHKFLHQRFGHIALLPRASAPDGAAAALPLAIFGNFSTSALGFLTHDYQLVTRPDWSYDSELLNYGSGADDSAEGPLVVKGAAGVGAVDLKGHWVVAPTFDELTPFEHGLAFGRTDGELTLIDATGKTYPKPEGVINLARQPDRVLIGSREDRRVRVDLKTGQVTPAPPAVSDDAADHVRDMHGGLAAAEKDDKWGLVDAAGKWVAAPQWVAEPKPLLHHNGLLGWTVEASVNSAGQGAPLVSLLDPRGQELLKPVYTALSVDEQSGLLIAERHYLRSVLAPSGKTVLPPVDGTYAGLGDGWFKVDLEPLHGIIDGRGQWTAGPGRTRFSLDTRLPSLIPPFTVDGHGAERRLTDWTGRVSTPAAPLAFNRDEPSQGWWSEETEGEPAATVFRSFDFKERLRLPGKAHSRFSEGVIAYAPADPKQAGKLVLADDKGAIVGRYAVDEIDIMTGGMARVTSKVLLKPAGKGGAAGSEEPVKRHGYINRAGKLAVPIKFEEAGDFSERRATVIASSGLAMIDEAGSIVLQGAWQCGRTPVLIDAAKNIVWPEQARSVTRCTRPPAGSAH